MIECIPDVSALRMKALSKRDGKGVVCWNEVQDDLLIIKIQIDERWFDLMQEFTYMLMYKGERRGRVFREMLFCWS